VRELAIEEDDPGLRQFYSIADIANYVSIYVYYKVVKVQLRAL